VGSLDVAGAADNPLQGLSLDPRLQPALASARVPVASLDGPDRYGFAIPKLNLEGRLVEAVGLLGEAHAKSSDPALRQAGSTAVQVQRLRTQLAPFSGSASTNPYPRSSKDDFPLRLQGLAQMLAAGLPLHCVAMRAPGMYDTHSGQPGALDQGLKLTADSLLAFQREP